MNSFLPIILIFIILVPAWLFVMGKTGITDKKWYDRK